RRGRRPLACARGAAHGDGALHSLGSVPVDRAVHVVGTRFRERDPERHGRAGRDVPGLLLDPVSLDLEGVWDGSVVRDLELVCTRLGEPDGARAQRELLLGDLDRLASGATSWSRGRTASAAGSNEEGYGQENNDAAHVHTLRWRTPLGFPGTVSLRDGPVAQLVRAADS